MFFSLLFELIPLYFLVGIGFLGGTFLPLKVEDVARVLVFLITPVVFFGSIAQLPFSYLSLFLIFLPWIPSVLTLLFIGTVTQDSVPEADRRVITAASTLSNGGYFGIPLYVLLFGDAHLGFWMLIVVGSTLFEVTAAYYQLARARFSVKESFYRLLKLPVLWGALLALLWAIAGLPLPKLFLDLHREFRGAYMVLGMMLLGISLSQISIKMLPVRLLLMGMSGRLLVFPIFMIAFISLEERLFGFMLPPMREAALLFGFLPVAVNAVAYAAELKLSTSLIGGIVFFSTILATLIVSLVFPWILLTFGF